MFVYFMSRNMNVGINQFHKINLVRFSVFLTYPKHQCLNNVVEQRFNQSISQLTSSVIITQLGKIFSAFVQPINSLPLSKKPTIEPILSQLNPVSTLLTLSSKLHFNIFLTSLPACYKWSLAVSRLNCCMHFLRPPTAFSNKSHY